MKAAKGMAVVCIAALSFTILAGCGRSTQSTDDSLAQLAEYARQEGYNQCYVEIAYGMNKGVPEEDYNNYLELKQQYEADKTLENLKLLGDATQQILQNMP